MEMKLINEKNDMNVLHRWCMNVRFMYQIDSIFLGHVQQKYHWMFESEKNTSVQVRATTGKGKFINKHR